jgi:hypothetical protein
MKFELAALACVAVAIAAASPSPVSAATEQPKKHSKAATTKKAATKPAKAAKAAPKPAEPEDDTPLSPTQLDAASHVITGRADCEFKQNVLVTPVTGRPGHFDVAFGKQTFHMTPEETTTGAVRLRDRRADVVWLQIPVKSMLMNHKAGVRMVDACQHPEQRAAVEAVAQSRVAAAAAEKAASAADMAASAAGTAAVKPATAEAASAAATAAKAASAAAAAASAAVPNGSRLAGPLEAAPAASSPTP